MTNATANGNVPHVWTVPEGLTAGAECEAAALDYLRRGWPPTACCDPNHFGVGKEHGRRCKSLGKAPMHRWKEHQTHLPTEKEVRGWWRSWANANVGLVLGTTLVRVDADGENGQARLRELCGGDPPKTLSFTSGQPLSLGLLYAVPPGVKLQSKTEPFKIGKHNELRLQGLGAQTVLPPSRHYLGTRYRWLERRGPDEIEAAQMPPWMVRLMSEREERPRGAAAPSGAVDRGDRTRALQLLAALNPERAADYDTWVKVGMILHRIDDSDAMCEEWDRWSATCEEKYVDGLCAAKWATFDRERKKGVTLGTLIFLAKADGWRPPTPRLIRTRPGHYALRCEVEV
jgi:hypothetical protein